MININVFKRKFNRGTVTRYSACVSSNPQIGINELVERIEQRCTVTKSDIVAVLAAFQEQVIYAMRYAQMVSLGDLGNLYLRLHCKLAETSEQFTTDNIRSITVGFRPRKAFKSKLQKGQSGIKFKVAKQEAAEEPAPSDPSAGTL